MTKRKTIVWIGATIAILLLSGLATAAYLYRAFMVTPFAIQPIELFIDQDTTLEGLLSELEQSAPYQSVANLKRIAQLRGYQPDTRQGHYTIKPESSCYQVYTQLSRGLQQPVKVVFNNLRTTQQLADRVASQLQFDSEELMLLLTDSAVCAQWRFTPTTISTLFLPDTYDCYWTISPQQFLQKMKVSYDQYWNQTRLQQLAKTQLTPIEATILASIVEEETKAVDEMNIVAGLYLNRLNRGMLLQADPTVKFALQEFDLRRILFTHLEVDSPYNTYKYAGLPPGPIRIPSKTAINAVLNFATHNYLYMCAREQLDGRHNFARTLAEHSRNARRYQQALSQRKIYQ